MRLVVRSYHFWIGLALLAAFWISAYILPNWLMLLLSNSFMLCASVAVGIAYIPIAVRAVRQGKPRRAVAISLGICYAWNFGAMLRLTSLFWLTSGQNMALVNNDVVSMCQGGIGLGALLHLTTVSDRGDTKTTMHWSLIAVVIVAALTLAGLLAVFQPDTRWLADRVVPWIPR